MKEILIDLDDSLDAIVAKVTKLKKNKKKSN